MNYWLNVKSSSIVHTLLSDCVKLLGKVQKLLIQFINYSVISKRICVVSPKFYTARKNFTGPPVTTVPTNFKSDFYFFFHKILTGAALTILAMFIVHFNSKPLFQTRAKLWWVKYFFPSNCALASNFLGLLTGFKSEVSSRQISQDDNKTQEIFHSFLFTNFHIL